MAVQIKPDPQMEDEKSLVHYIINVSEGDVYKMGELEILGVDTTSKDRLRGPGVCVKGSLTTPITPENFSWTM